MAIKIHRWREKYAQLTHRDRAAFLDYLAGIADRSRDATRKYTNGQADLPAPLMDQAEAKLDEWLNKYYTRPEAQEAQTTPRPGPAAERLPEFCRAIESPPPS